MCRYCYRTRTTLTSLPWPVPAMPLYSLEVSQLLPWFNAAPLDELFGAILRSLQTLSFTYEAAEPSYSSLAASAVLVRQMDRAEMFHRGLAVAASIGGEGCEAAIDFHADAIVLYVEPVMGDYGICDLVRLHQLRDAWDYRTRHTGMDWPRLIIRCGRATMRGYDITFDPPPPRKPPAPAKVEPISLADLRDLASAGRYGAALPPVRFTSEGGWREN